MGFEQSDASEGGRAVTGKATGEKGVGVYGSGRASGVRGDGETWHGVAGLSKSTTGGYGVYGKNTSGGTGVAGESDEWMGVYGSSVSTKGGAGVMGEHKNDGIGVIGKSAGGVGVWGRSETHEGIHAETESNKTSAIAAYQMNEDSSSAAIFARHAGKGVAGRFEGDLVVTGDIRLSNADLAEQFEVIGDSTAPLGSVMVLAGQDCVRVSDTAYDRKVAGVLSGAGDYNPGVVLGAETAGNRRHALALSGKVWVLADADQGAIEVGELLTTSSTSGHAMCASDPTRAFGSVIGKALDPLPSGRGLIRALVALQ